MEILLRAVALNERETGQEAQRDHQGGESGDDLVPSADATPTAVVRRGQEVASGRAQLALMPRIGGPRPRGR
jgi:hypothetical protein